VRLGRSPGSWLAEKGRTRAATSESVKPSHADPQLCNRWPIELARRRAALGERLRALP